MNFEAECYLPLWKSGRRTRKGPFLAYSSARILLFGRPSPKMSGMITTVPFGLLPCGGAAM